MKGRGHVSVLVQLTCLNVGSVLWACVLWLLSSEGQEDLVSILITPAYLLTSVLILICNLLTKSLAPK